MNVVPFLLCPLDFGLGRETPAGGVEWVVLLDLASDDIEVLVITHKKYNEVLSACIKYSTTSFCN